MVQVTSPAGGFQRSVVLVGLMGAGKTSVGRRLAKLACSPFTDADDEIVAGRDEIGAPGGGVVAGDEVARNGRARVQMWRGPDGRIVVRGQA